MAAETANTNLCNIALIGTKFMGRAHSNAYLKVDKFFDLPCAPVMHTVAARNQEELKIFADRWGWQHCATDWKSAVNSEDIDLVDVVTTPTTFMLSTRLRPSKQGNMSPVKNHWLER